MRMMIIQMTVVVGLSTGATSDRGMANRARMSESPRLLDDDYRLELSVREPQIVAPIGIAFDHADRLMKIFSRC